jgi:hypothetical protein
VYVKVDPGPCPVDDAPHTTCVAPATDPLTIVQLPMRDGYTEPPLVGSVTLPALVGDLPSQAPTLFAERLQATLPPDQVTTGTYRRKRKDG